MCSLNLLQTIQVMWTNRTYVSIDRARAFEDRGTLPVYANIDMLAIEYWWYLATQKQLHSPFKCKYFKTLLC